MVVVCTHAQVHEEVLRLLLAVAKQLSPEQLGRYLQTTIQRSRKSRRCEPGGRGEERDSQPHALSQEDQLQKCILHLAAAPLMHCVALIAGKDAGIMLVRLSLSAGSAVECKTVDSAGFRRRFKRRKVEPLGGIPFGTDGYSSGGYSSGGFLSGYRSSGLLNGSGAGEHRAIPSACWPQCRHDSDNFADQRPMECDAAQLPPA